jgi:hypothetical protein
MVVPVLVGRSEGLLDEDVYNAPPQPLLDQRPTAPEPEPAAA